MLRMDSMLNIRILSAPAPEHVGVSVDGGVVLRRHHGDTAKIGAVWVAVFVPGKEIG